MLSFKPDQMHQHQAPKIEFLDLNDSYIVKTAFLSQVGWLQKNQRRITTTAGMQAP